MSAFFLPFFPFTNSCPSRPGHVWFLFPLTTNWPLLANWFPPHNQLPGPFSPPQPTCLIAHYGQVTFPLHNQWACHFSPTQPIAYCFPVSFPLTTNCLLFPSLFPPSQPIACHCCCNKKSGYCCPASFIPLSLFPPHKQLPIVPQSLSPFTTNCLPLPLQQKSGFCCPVSFMPPSLFSHTTNCLLFPSLFPPLLTTNCLSLPLQQPSGHCCPASFMPADNRNGAMWCMSLGLAAESDLGPRRLT